MAIGPVPARLALDTSAYSQLRRGHALVLDWVAGADVVLVPTTVIGELEAGFQLGRRCRENQVTLSEFLDEPFVQTINITSAVARRYGVVLSQLRRAGTPIPVNDIWIASAAIEANAQLLTFDGDFDHVQGLHVTVFAIAHGS